MPVSLPLASKDFCLYLQPFRIVRTFYLASLGGSTASLSLPLEMKKNIHPACMAVVSQLHSSAFLSNYYQKR
jgi:hypothetical protein